MVKIGQKLIRRGSGTEAVCGGWVERIGVEIVCGGIRLLRSANARRNRSTESRHSYSPFFLHRPTDFARGALGRPSIGYRAGPETCTALDSGRAVPEIEAQSRCGMCDAVCITEPNANEINQVACERRVSCRACPRAGERAYINARVQKPKERSRPLLLRHPRSLARDGGSGSSEAV